MIQTISKIVNVPLIVSGGMKDANDILELYKNLTIEAYSMADILHYNRLSISNLKKILYKNSLPVRLIDCD